jgi:hypothetical protein
LAFRPYDEVGYGKYSTAASTIIQVSVDYSSLLLSPFIKHIKTEDE